MSLAALPLPTWPRFCASCRLRSCRPSPRSVTTLSAIHNGIRGDNGVDKMRSKIAAYEAQRRRPGRATKSDDQQAYSNTERSDDAKSKSNGERKQFGSVSVPHTTAASKFIYGYSSVYAALKARRRLLYKLYYHPRAERRASSELEKEREMDQEGMILALTSHGGKKVIVEKVGEDFLAVMDKISGGRPHNGIVLETSPLPIRPVQSLISVSRLSPWFQVEAGRQSPEAAMINGTDNRIRYNSHGWRFPLVLFLHGITDTGNIGAILRSAYYLGVDAVALASRSTASVDDPVVIKASSGATEAVRILRVSNPFAFLSQSARNGWRIYTAEAPPPPEDNFSLIEDEKVLALDPRNTSPLVSFRRVSSQRVMIDHSPLVSHPAILMMGGEHAGVDAKLATMAHYKAGIRGVNALDIGIDSMNVSVASAIIALEMLKKPNQHRNHFAPSEPKAGSNFLF